MDRKIGEDIRRVEGKVYTGTGASNTRPGQKNENGS